MSEKRKKYTPIVKEILKVSERARKDDNYLWMLVLEGNGFKTTEESVFDLLTKVQESNLPSLGTISRIRRKVQEENEELKADRHTILVRQELEREWKAEMSR